LPPSIILEVLKITEAEMELRDLTRETEQAKSALTEDEYDARTRPLAYEQDDIAGRVKGVMDDIRKLPDGSRTFGSEMRMLATARRAMVEAFDLLDAADTGRETIAAETEAIELLLQSRRSGGGGGGGGGASPGGGGGGTDGSSALALAGRSIGEGERIEQRDVKRSTTRTLSKIPIEFQEALDLYFEAIEGTR
jgi:hypothetical protein